MKAVKVVVVLVVIVVIAVVALRAVKQMGFRGEYEAVKSLHENAETIDELMNARAAYEELLPKAPDAEAERVVKGGIASCDANIAYLDAQDKGGIRKYKSAIELMKIAQEFTGDPQGVWPERIADFEERLEQSYGPSLDELRRKLASARQKPFRDAAMDLEFIFRWAREWREEGVFQDDEARQRIAQEATDLLREGYSKMFLETVEEARAMGDSRTTRALERKSAVLDQLIVLKHVDEGLAQQYQKEYADDIVEAQKAKDELGLRLSGGAE